MVGPGQDSNRHNKHRWGTDSLTGMCCCKTKSSRALRKPQPAAATVQPSTYSVILRLAPPNTPAQPSPPLLARRSPIKTSSAPPAATSAASPAATTRNSRTVAGLLPSADGLAVAATTALPEATREGVRDPKGVVGLAPTADIVSAVLLER